jgi:hypothetical protein
LGGVGLGILGRSPCALGLPYAMAGTDTFCARLLMRLFDQGAFALAIA